MAKECGLDVVVGPVDVVRVVEEELEEYGGREAVEITMIGGAYGQPSGRCSINSCVAVAMCGHVMKRVSKQIHFSFHGFLEGCTHSVALL